VCCQAGQAAPVAPLDGIGSFDCDTPGEYDLEVTGKPGSKPRDIKATDFQVIQGDPDTAYTIDPSTGTVTPDTTKRVATVYKETGAVVYRVSGEYVIHTRPLPGAPPRTPPTWGATYNYGDKRLVLYVNSERSDDDFVGLTAEGTVTVTLPFADDGFTYTVQLSDGTGEGTVEFLDSATVTLGSTGGGWAPSAVVRIRGQTAGENMIHAANTAVSGGGNLLSTPDGVDAPCPVLSLVVNSIAIKAANPQSPKAQRVVSDSTRNIDLGANPEWTATDGCRAPAAFVRRKIGDPTPPPPVKLQVTFTPYADMTVDIRATVGPDLATDVINETFAANAAKTLTFTLTQAADIGSTVSIRRWDLTWDVRPQGETEWSTVCTSTHRVFVLYDTPPVNNISRESYFYISCDAADGENLPSSIVWKLRSRFSTSARGGASITNAGRQRLGFWRPTGQMSATELVNDTSGQCRAWAELFNQCLLVQGLQQYAKGVRGITPNTGDFARPDGTVSLRMTIPVYSWGQPTQATPWEYTYNARSVPQNVVGYAHWPKPPPDPECSYVSCLAHDNSNAPSEWLSHCIAVMEFPGGEYLFDPSYGNNVVAADIESLAAFENDMFTRSGAVAGGFHVLCPIGGVIRGRASKDPPGQQLQAE